MTSRVTSRVTIPANLAERHYAEQSLLAAVVAERKALHEMDTHRDWPHVDAYCRAAKALNQAGERYYAAVQADERVADPIVENIAEAGTFEVHDCPGGAYVITEVDDLAEQAEQARQEWLADEVEVPDLLGALQASIERHRAQRDAQPNIDPADRYDSGYVASPAEAAGRAADEFYGREG